MRNTETKIEIKYLSDGKLLGSVTIAGYPMHRVGEIIEWKVLKTKREATRRPKNPHKSFKYRVDDIHNVFEQDEDNPHRVYPVMEVHLSKLEN